jgi:outer membrane protein OmpA-like peptidoglycan-associated protein
MSARMTDSRCWETNQQHRIPKRAVQASDLEMLQRANTPEPSGVTALQRLVGNRATAHLCQTKSSVERAGVTAQRQSAPKTTTCTYEPGEKAKSRKAAGILDTKVAFAGFLSTLPEFLTTNDSEAVVVTDFEIGSGELRPATRSLLTQWSKTYRPTDPLEFIGFTDCVGMESQNSSLRQKRAQAVADVFPSSGNKVIGTAPFSAYPPTGPYLADNTSSTGRALNRSVVIRHPKAPPPAPIPKPPHRPDDPSVITKEEPASNSCSADQREQLSIAFPAAKRMAETALSAITSGKAYGSNVVEFLLKRHFGKDAYSHLPEIRAGFSKILANWKNWEATFDCEVQTEGSCPNDDPHMVTLAYVMNKRHIFSPNQSYGTVHVCEKAFKMTDSMQKLSTVVLHELSHRLDNTDDKKYCGFNGEGKCESLSTEAAIDNADSYAQFAHEYFNASIQ